MQLGSNSQIIKSKLIHIKFIWNLLYCNSWPFCYHKIPCTEYNSFENIKLQYEENHIAQSFVKSVTMSQRKLVTQYMKGLTPLTNCRCLELEALSSIRTMVKLAGMKDMANMTQIAITTSIAPWYLKRNTYRYILLIFWTCLLVKGTVNASHQQFKVSKRKIRALQNKYFTYDRFPYFTHSNCSFSWVLVSSIGWLTVVIPKRVGSREGSRLLRRIRLFMALM